MAVNIGTLAHSTGLTTKTIRYYESIGVLPEPQREENGYRSYDGGSIDRIGFIRDAQVAGLSLIELQMILGLRDEGESTCRHVIDGIETHMIDLDRQMQDLERTKVRLGQIIDRARTLDPSDCNDPNRCQTISNQN